MASFNGSSIRKVLIPVAGLGTRFLPFSKTVPKEMLPIVDTPSILLLVEEALDAGFHEIILVQGRGKHSIEDFFDVSYELEDTLMRRNKYNLLSRVAEIRDKVSIISVRQKQPLGLGHAVLTGRSIIGDEPFAVMLGDELMSNSTELLRLKNSYLENGISTVSVMEVPMSEVSKYGVIEPQTCADTGRIFIKNLVEKPPTEKAPSNWALPGRYVFSPKIFDYIEGVSPGAGGEIQLTDAMVKMAQNEGLLAMPIRSKRYDLGDKFGFLKANIEYGLIDPQISQQLKSYLQEISAEI